MTTRDGMAGHEAPLLGPARPWSPLSQGVLVTAANGRVLAANPAALALLGLSMETLLALDLSQHLQEAIPPGRQAQPEAVPSPGAALGRRMLGWVRPTGEAAWLDWSATAIRGGRVLVRFEDVTATRTQAATLERLTCLYAALSQVNQAILWTATREALLARICEVMVVSGRFAMAWVAINDPLTHQVAVACQYGDSAGYLADFQARSDDTPLGRGPIGTSIREGHPCLSNDFLGTPHSGPWQAKAIRAGYAAVASFPIRLRGTVLGALAVYATVKDFFGPPELALLEEAAEDVSYALGHLEELAERQRIGNELHRAQANVTALIESTSDLIWSVDREHRLLIFNSALAEHFRVSYGTTPFPGAAPEDVLPPHRAEVWANLYERVFSEGAFTKEIALADGRLLEVAFHPIEGDHGLLGASVFGKDITERKQAEDRLREALAFNQKLLGAGPMGVQVFDGASGRCLLVTEGIIRIVGGSIPELRAQNFRTIASWPGSGLLAAAEQALATGEDQYLEPRFQTTFQREVWLFCHFTTLQNQGQQHLLLTMFDISERKRAENALRESEERYRTQFELSAEGIMALSTTCELLEVNEAFARMHGYTREEALRLNLKDLDTAESSKLSPERLARILAGEALTFEVEHWHKDGHAFPLEVSAGLVFSGGKTIILNYHRDITERVRAEQAQRQAQKLESLGVLAGGIAHDFNNLLTAIMGNLNLAQVQIGEHAPARPFLEKVENTVLKAAELSRQMLAYSGKGHFVVKPMDLNAIIQEMTRLLAASIPKKIHLELGLGHDLPLFKADGAQIQQVVMNLITNAAEAIGPGEGQITITTYNATLDREILTTGFPGQAVEGGDYLVLSVADTGCGMAPEVRSRIFDPFFTTKASGRGLGLSAMLGILKGHKAGIRIETEVAQGTLFSIYFPALGEGEFQEEPAPSRRERRMAGTVLLVDDEESILESTAPALESFGFRVVKARDGIQALEQFMAMGKDLALVFMDLSMPRMDGTTAFMAMRRARPEVPVILTSGYNQKEVTEDLMAQGLAGFVQKPYRLQDLARELDRALEHRQE